MAAEISSMMYLKNDGVPWHGQGVPLDNPATAEEAMIAAGLGWDVQIQPMYTGPARNVRIKDRFAVCRTDRLDQADGGQLGVVGRDYCPLQNRQAFGFLDPVISETRAIYHTAGALRGGRRVWLLAKLPTTIRIVGDDIAEKYVLLSNSHDGSSAVRIGLTPIRVVCMNTLNVALRSMAGLSIRHEADVVQRVQQAHILLGLLNDGFTTTELAMQQMARTPMGADRLKEFFEQVLPVPANDPQEREKVVKRHDRLTELFETGIGTDLPGVRGTLWCAYNAVSEFVDHTPRSRVKEPLNYIWFGEGERLKRHAIDRAVAFMGMSLN